MHWLFDIQYNHMPKKENCRNDFGSSEIVHLHWYCNIIVREVQFEMTFNAELLHEFSEIFIIQESEIFAKDSSKQ